MPFLVSRYHYSMPAQRLQFGQRRSSTNSDGASTSTLELYTHHCDPARFEQNQWPKLLLNVSERQIMCCVLRAAAMFTPNLQWQQRLPAPPLKRNARARRALTCSNVRKNFQTPQPIKITATTLRASNLKRGGANERWRLFAQEMPPRHVPRCRF